MSYMGGLFCAIVYIKTIFNRNIKKMIIKGYCQNYLKTHKQRIYLLQSYNYNRGCRDRMVVGFSWRCATLCDKYCQ